MPGNNTQRMLLADWQAISKRQFDEYATAWRGGQISLMDFELLFKQELKDLYIAAAWTAGGGPDNTSQSAYGRTGRALRDQYGFMHEMFQDVAAGKLSVAQLNNRMAQYAESSGALFERVANADEGLPQLPHVPKDGSTRCRANCHCETVWQEAEGGGWDVTWKLNPGDSCADCKRRNGKVCQIRNGKVINPTVWD